MTKTYFFSLLVALTAFFFTACTKHDHDEDNEAPVLTLEEPEEGSTVTGEVHIEGKVTDESLHEMSIALTRDSDGSELFSTNPEVHDETEYDFHEHYQPTALAGETAVTLTIVVEDHRENKTTKTVKFKVKP